MSLRRRITAAAALAVAAVAVSLGAIGYLSTRSQLIDQIQQELRDRATPYRQPPSRQNGTAGGGHAGQSATASGSHGPSASATPGVPAAPPLGGAPGYFQFVFPDGRVEAGGGGTPELPVTTRVLEVAKRGRGSFFWTTRVRRTHVEVFTVADASNGNAVEVALPLTGVDSDLHGLLLTYALLVGGGVLAALVVGLMIARAALAPIDRFSTATEQVTSALDRPRRLEEGGADELRRLAASFNQTLDALEQSIRAQRHLIADASHELRTPMAALRSNIQIFLESERLPEQERSELQDSIVTELDHLTQLVSDVLELARGSAPSEHVEPLELDALVREAVGRAQRRAPHIEFTLDLEPTVTTNSPDRVSRAITNVIDNARKWSPPDGTIEVTLHDGVLTVRDHGPGFGDADLEHIFDRFYRADQARRMPGSGLGLAIVKQAAEAHGGFAEAVNARDRGAILRVSFGPSIKAAQGRGDPASSQAGQ